MKRFILFSLFLSQPAWAAFRVVLDPGHGGTDHGAVFQSGSSRVAEKEITLILAKQVARLLREEKDLEVALTRQDDREVPLPLRSQIANENQADLFISIHMNSTQPETMGRTEGVETYILNTATDASSRRLAQIEKNSDVDLILKDLRLDANLPRSKKLACALQQNLVRVTASKAPQLIQHRDRGVKQALFYVLLGTNMPSVLLELGFINSARDRSMLLAPRTQELMSRAISTAIQEYRQSFKNPLILASHLNKCKIN